MSIDRWMDKEDVVHTYSGILLSHKKEWNDTICSYMDEPRDDHTKWNQIEKAKYHMITGYVWNLRKWLQMNIFI